MIEKPVANTQTETHTYALNWTAEAITWLIDGEPQRTLKYADANGGKTFPQTPCNVRLGNWPGGDSPDKGTVEWAGGKVDYKTAPFTMTVESVKVINYSPGLEYKWTDKSGSFESIEVIGAGNQAGAPQNTAVIEPSATASGKPLASGIDAPGKPGVAYPTGSGSPPKPSGGSANSPSDESDSDSPCECGTATVTVTGAPPPASNAPPASFTTFVSALPPSSIISSVAVPIVTAKPPPFPTSGLLTETNPPPVIPVPNPSAPSAGLPTPSRNATISAPPAQFTGGASRNGAGVLVGAFAGAVLLAF
jgi:hypothetical protein